MRDKADTSYRHLTRNEKRDALYSIIYCCGTKINEEKVLVRCKNILLIKTILNKKVNWVEVIDSDISEDECYLIPKDDKKHLKFAIKRIFTTSGSGRTLNSIIQYLYTPILYIMYDIKTVYVSDSDKCIFDLWCRKLFYTNNIDTAHNYSEKG